MPLPSKSKQVEAVIGFLDQERNQERSLEEIAKEVVEGYHSLIMDGLKVPMPPPRLLELGLLFKHPADGKARRVAWLSEFYVWIASDSGVGWFGPRDTEYWTFCELYEPAKMVETGEIGDDLKPKKKRVPKTQEEIDLEWSNPDFKVGDRLSQSQRRLKFEVVAVSPDACLLEMEPGGLYVDDNASLKQFYRHEISKEVGEW